MNGQCEICERRGWIHVHHIEGRKVLYCKHRWNEVRVCPNCHASIHAGDIKVVGWRMTSVGRDLEYVVNAKAIKRDENLAAAVKRRDDALAATVVES